MVLIREGVLRSAAKKPAPGTKARLGRCLGPSMGPFLGFCFGFSLECLIGAHQGVDGILVPIGILVPARFGASSRLCVQGRSPRCLFVGFAFIQLELTRGSRVFRGFHIFRVFLVVCSFCACRRDGVATEGKGHAHPRFRSKREHLLRRSVRIEVEAHLV